MQSLNEILKRNGEQWTGAAVTIRVSSGVCGFQSMKDLGRAIEDADRAMYDSRHRERQANKDLQTSASPLRHFQDKPG